MAKKISIEFSAQPLTTMDGFSYTIQVSGFDIYYSNGYNELIVNYLDFGSTPTNYYEVAVGNTLDETLQITLNFLRQNYINDLITYSLNGNIIEVVIQGDAVVTIGDLNDNITVTTTDIEPDVTNLIYYLIFDNYTLNFYKKNYIGNATEVFGNFKLKKSSAETILTPIRGTGLNISLEANQTLTFDEFLLADEFTYKTELLLNSDTIFEGYIKPDGIQQSYVNDLWYINIESVDGLGLLKDLSFVQANGLRFTGKLSMYDIIKACLDRTKLSLTINTSIAVEYIGYAGANVLKDVYLNVDRFIKNKDDNVLMDCNEVLTSTLNLFSGVITQQDGKWWIFRPNDLVLNGYTEFINQDTNATFTKNLNYPLGSQVNNFYPHHCDSNQQIEVKGAISGYRLNYEYGFLDGFLLNSNLNHDESMVFEDWSTNPSLPSYVTIINDPISTSGLSVKTELPSFWPGLPIPLPQIGLIPILESTPITALENQILTFRTKISSRNVKCFFKFQIYTSTGLYLNQNFEWVSDATAYFIVKCGDYSSAETFLNYELVLPSIPVDCDLSVIICASQIYPRNTFPYEIGICNVNYIQILDNEIQKAGIVGEFHTVTRKNPPSSIVKENQKVYNGDGTAILIGSIYKDDLETLTDLWTRKNKFESLPLLGISAMDDLRIQAQPIKVFSGSIFGQLPYLAVVTIDNVDGLFMFIEYEYDYKLNKIESAKLLQFYNEDIADIQYEISPDYGKSTVKPTIKG